MNAAETNRPGSGSTSSEVAGFIRKYAPEIARAFRASRRKMRGLVPRGYELVHDNYNALGIGYGYGQKASETVLSIVAYPRWVTLFFLQNGAKLKDPRSLLQGKGNQIRSIRLQSPNDLDRPEVLRLIDQALAPYLEAFAACPRIRTIIKAVAEKQRPRRPSNRGAG